MTAVMCAVGSLLAGLPSRRNASTERGAILVEYTLLIALIVLMCLAAVTQFGAKVPSASFTSVASSI